jgi:hypothetical protein
LDKTEVIYDNLNPDFEKSMIVDYIFEVHQIFKVIVKDVDDHGASFDLIGDASFELGDLIGSRKNPSVLGLIGGVVKHKGLACIRWETVGNNRDQLQLGFRCTGLMDIQVFSKTDPFLKFSRPTGIKTNEAGDGQFYEPKDIPANNWVLVYTTEHHMSNLDPEFKAFTISGEKISKGDYS